jgi:hypothetical protein
MSRGVHWVGLTQYRASLLALPTNCVREASNAIVGETNAAFVTIAQVYEAHRLTGALRKGLTVSVLGSPGGLITGRVLKSNGALAWLFDNGSVARHYVTRSGADHKTGRMWGKTPPTHIFTRTVGRARRRLTQTFRDILLRQGATSVTGD